MLHFVKRGRRDQIKTGTFNIILCIFMEIFWHSSLYILKEEGKVLTSGVAWQRLIGAL